MNSSSRNIRVISRLDIKGEYLIKGVHLEGLRRVGDPNAFALEYYSQGCDELICMDIVASLYGRNNLSEIVRKVTNDVFVPITVGGGIRSVEDAARLLRAGADKVAINTAATQRPDLVTSLADKFGSQCVVASIEAKRSADGRWEVFTDNGREKTGLDVIDWIEKLQILGAGELLITSVDFEGTRKGFDLELASCISKVASIPVIYSGGFGDLRHATELLEKSNVDAIAVADFLHYKRGSIKQIKSELENNGFSVRV